MDRITEGGMKNYDKSFVNPDQYLKFQPQKLQPTPEEPQMKIPFPDVKCTETKKITIKTAKDFKKY